MQQITQTFIFQSDNFLSLLRNWGKCYIGFALSQPNRDPVGDGYYLQYLLQKFQENVRG